MFGCASSEVFTGVSEMCALDYRTDSTHALRQFIALSYTIYNWIYQIVIPVAKYLLYSFTLVHRHMTYFPTLKRLKK